MLKIKGLLAEIEEVLAAQGRSERLRDGLVVAIAGPPNVGKSTLMNYLARREVAIVSPHAGTTRDIIEVQLDLDGYPVTVIDTAGIRETDDPVEQEGVRRARARAAEADLVLWLADAQHERNSRRGRCAGLAGAQQDRSRRRPAGWGGNPNWPTDLGQGGGAIEFRISAGRGDGMPELISALVGFAQDYFGSDDGGLIGRARQRKLLQETAASLQRSIEVVGTGEELAAEDLRAAAHSLGGCWAGSMSRISSM